MKIGFLITARLKSTRLPLKIIKDLNGSTVIERIIDRAKQIQNISEIVVCTSNNPQDKPLFDIAQKNNIQCYMGHPEDVMTRLKDAGRYYGLDCFVGITAENPLFSIQHANLMVNRFEQTQCDLVKIIGLPVGAATYGVKIKALEVICKIKDVVDTEIWGILIDRPEIFKVDVIEVNGIFKHPNLRLTIDYPEDYELIDHIYKHFKDDEIVDLYKVMQYLNDHPEVKKINANRTQADLPQQVKNKINIFFQNNKEKILELKREIYNG